MAEEQQTEDDPEQAEDYRRIRVESSFQACGHGRGITKINATQTQPTSGRPRGLAIPQRTSVRPHALDHVVRLDVRTVVVTTAATGQLPDPLSIGRVQGHVGAVEAQPHLGDLSTLLKDVSGKPHNGRSMINQHLATFTAESHTAA